MASESQATSSSKGKGKSYFTWTVQMDQVIGSCFIEQMNQGNKLDGKCAWKPIAWTAAIDALHHQLHISVTKTNIMSRFRTWEKHYEVLHPLLVSCNSGSSITWNHSKGRIEVHDENVWKERLEANPKLAPYRNKITIENWEDFCIIFSQDRANGEGAQTAGAANVEMELDENSTASESFESHGQSIDDDVMSILLARKKRLKTKASSSTDLRATKEKKTGSQVIYKALECMTHSLDRYLHVETQKATTQEVLDELKKVELDRIQLLKALDLMMHDQRLFDTFKGMADELRQQCILMHLRE